MSPDPWHFDFAFHSLTRKRLPWMEVSRRRSNRRSDGTAVVRGSTAGWPRKIQIYSRRSSVKLNKPFHKSQPMRAAENLVELRRLLAEKFPQAHTARRLKSALALATGVPQLDALLGGGWPKGRLSELVGAGAGSGSAQVIHALLHRVAADGRFLALVDGLDSFDVDAVEPDVLARLLWVRCARADEALKAADILLRDRNFPVVVVDLKLNSVSQLRKIPSSAWHRFRRLQEQNGTTVLIITPTPLVGGTHCRVRVEGQLGIEAMAKPPAEVAGRLQFALLRVEEEESRENLVKTG